MGNSFHKLAALEAYDMTNRHSMSNYQEPETGQIISKNDDGTYEVKIDGSNNTYKRVNSTTSGGDFGIRDKNTGQINDVTTHGDRNTYEEGERVLLLFVGGKDIYPMIIGAVSNIFNLTVKEEFDRGRGRQHKSGSFDFFDDANGDYVVQHAVEGKMTISEAKFILEHATEILFGSTSATQPFVKGTVFNTFANAVKTYLDSHTHTYNPGPSPPAPTTPPIAPSPTVPAEILSTKIKGE